VRRQSRVAGSGIGAARVARGKLTRDVLLMSADRTDLMQERDTITHGGANGQIRNFIEKLRMRLRTAAYRGMRGGPFHFRDVLRNVMQCKHPPTLPRVSYQCHDIQTHSSDYVLSLRAGRMRHTS
jgi:hypothetical protein